MSDILDEILAATESVRHPHVTSSSLVATATPATTAPLPLDLCTHHAAATTAKPSPPALHAVVQLQHQQHQQYHPQEQQHQQQQHHHQLHHQPSAPFDTLALPSSAVQPLSFLAPCFAPSPRGVQEIPPPFASHSAAAAAAVAVAASPSAHNANNAHNAFASATDFPPLLASQHSHHTVIDHSPSHAPDDPAAATSASTSVAPLSFHMLDKHPLSDPALPTHSPSPPASDLLAPAPAMYDPASPRISAAAAAAAAAGLSLPLDLAAACAVPPVLPDTAAATTAALLSHAPLPLSLPVATSSSTTTTTTTTLNVSQKRPFQPHCGLDGAPPTDAVLPPLPDAELAAAPLSARKRHKVEPCLSPSGSLAAGAASSPPFSLDEAAGQMGDDAEAGAFEGMCGVDGKASTSSAVMPPSAKSILERRERAIREGRRKDAKLSEAERRILRRLRNRESAERCRLRRVQQAVMLERKMESMQHENERLVAVAEEYERTIARLQRVLETYSACAGGGTGATAAAAAAAASADGDAVCVETTMEACHDSMGAGARAAVGDNAAH